MPGAGERAYAYAKACGIVGKSFVGKRIPALESADRLAALDRLVFPRGGRELPERELLHDLEKRITGRAVSQIMSIVSSFSHPPEFLALLVRGWEYGDLKSSLNALVSGESSFKDWTDIGALGTVNFAAFPDLPAMLKDTEFGFLLDKEMNLVRGGDAVAAQTALDKRYYLSLWRALKKLPKRDRVSSEKILAEEISLRNAVWVLRLRTYYGMSGEDAAGHLMDIDPRDRRGGRSSSAANSLAADARAILDLPLDSRAPWADWKRERFLNPERPGDSWRADPRYFQNAAGAYLYRLALRSFRLKPFSLDVVFCFIRLKQFEDDLLTSVAEGLGLGMSSQDVFALLEVEA
ncbi:MAG: V-type ATPase subunit [Treponema sp.]|jgi:vacuolar-type H+-ATPase subunit C/Vma6|nr:V-type ATPase subunit [Treponema sp.]